MSDYWYAQDPRELVRGNASIIVLIPTGYSGWIACNADVNGAARVIVFYGTEAVDAMTDVLAGGKSTNDWDPEWRWAFPPER